MEAAEGESTDDEEVVSQSDFSDGPPLVDDETYIRMVDPACSECDDGGTKLLQILHPRCQLYAPGAPTMLPSNNVTFPP